MTQDRIAFFPCFCCLSCSKQLLLMLVLEGIEAERSSIFQERSEGIDPRKLAWRLNHAHSWKESHCFQCCPVLCLLSLFCHMRQNLHAFLQEANVMSLLSFSLPIHVYLTASLKSSHQSLSSIIINRSKICCSARLQNR